MLTRFDGDGGGTATGQADGNRNGASNGNGIGVTPLLDVLISDGCGAAAQAGGMPVP